MNTNDTKSWYVVIDTDSYSGSFEREMCSYATGFEQCRGEGLGEEIQAAYGYDRKVFGTSWETHDANPFLLLFEESKNPAPSFDDWRMAELAHIWPTPGYGNDGHGKHRKIKSSADARRYSWPAYQSVIMKCSEEPSPKHLAILREWVEKFAARRNIQILNIRTMKMKSESFNNRIP